MIYLVGCMLDNYHQVKETLHAHEKTQSIYDGFEGFQGIGKQQALFLPANMAVLLVAFEGTTKELNDILGFGPDPGIGFIFQISDYVGFWPQSLWDWVKEYP